MKCVDARKHGGTYTGLYAFSLLFHPSRSIHVAESYACLLGYAVAG
jgi:hypothetical protein